MDAKKEDQQHSLWIPGIVNGHINGHNSWIQYCSFEKHCGTLCQHFNQLPPISFLRLQDRPISYFGDQIAGRSPSVVSVQLEEKKLKNFIIELKKQSVRSGGLVSGKKNKKNRK